MGTKTTTINLPWQKPAQHLWEKTMSASHKNDECLQKKRQRRMPGCITKIDQQEKQ